MYIVLHLKAQADLKAIVELLTCSSLMHLSQHHEKGRKGRKTICSQHCGELSCVNFLCYLQW